MQIRSSTNRILLGVCAVLLLGGAVVAEPLNVMTYNVWLGFNKKKNLAPAAEWIAAQDTDVLALQELKGFDQQRLEAAAKTWGHAYAVIFDRKGGFPQGLTSKTPIEKIEQIQPENNPALRGTLHCKTAGIHFFVVHLNPRNYQSRRREAVAVADRIKPLLKQRKKVIVLGDFNAHALTDRPALEGQEKLMAKWRAKEKERKGFKAFDSNGQLDCSVLQVFFDAGLVDRSEKTKPTFPTRLLFKDMPTEEFAGLQQRIDFILVSPPLAGGVIRYPRDAVLDSLSDHYPVVGEFDDPGAVGSLKKRK